MIRLKELRAEKGLSQAAIAENFGITQQAYANYERGNRKPDFDTLVKMADYFGVSTDYLLERDGKLTEEKQKTKDEKEIEKIIENALNDLESVDGLMFDGKPANEDEIEQIRAAMRVGLAMAKEKAREKFTPKKYRNK